VSGPGAGTGSGAGALSRPRLWRARAPLRGSVRLHGQHHRLVLESPEIAAAAEPGQFLHVWCHPPEEIERPPCAAILRRPFSISRLRPPDGIEVLLRARGTGGRMLAGKAAGELLDVIGPLGHGFRIRDGLQLAVLVAGGVGLAPAPFLIQRLVERGIRVMVMAGAADDEKVPFSVRRPRAGRATIPELTELGAEVLFVSESVEGLLITEVFEARLGELPAEGVDVFAIGPRAMLKRLAEVTGVHFPLQVSLEERMACGVGACRSCVVPVLADGGVSYRTVCRDGPVFYASDIAWDHLEA
jgi:dihydroorotate dehydrogenase electron transfer subunit